MQTLQQLAAEVAQQFPGERYKAVMSVRREWRHRTGLLPSLSQVVVYINDEIRRLTRDDPAIVAALDALADEARSETAISDDPRTTAVDYLMAQAEGPRFGRLSREDAELLIEAAIERHEVERQQRRATRQAARAAAQSDPADGQ